MNMQTLDTILFAYAERIAIAVVCLLGAGFMIWFLIALSLDGRRTRARSLIPDGRITIRRIINRKPVEQRRLDKTRHYEWHQQAASAPLQALASTCTAD
jgi:hypothetical protein